MIAKALCAMKNLEVKFSLSELKVVVSNTHEFHPKLKIRDLQLSRYMKLIAARYPAT